MIKIFIEGRKHRTNAKALYNEKTREVTVLKGSEVPNNTTVAFRAIVTKKFTEENTILAGAPAKVVKNNVNWERK